MYIGFFLAILVGVALKGNEPATLDLFIVTVFRSVVVYTLFKVFVLFETEVIRGDINDIKKDINDIKKRLGMDE